MNRFGIIGGAALIVTGIAAFAATQDHPSPAAQQKMMQAMQAWAAYSTPGAEQDWLSKQAGTFVTKASFRTFPEAPWVESEGVVVRRMDMGGRFLVEDFSGTLMGMPFLGRGTTGWDNGRSMFVTTWYDNMSTGIAQGIGQWNDDRTKIEWEITQTDPMTKSPITTKAEWWWRKDGTLVFDSWMPSPTGEHFHAMRIEFMHPAVPTLGGMDHPTGGEHPEHPEHPGHRGEHPDHPGR